MQYSKLRTLLYLTISLTLLFAPFSLEMFQDGKTYAFSSRSHNKSSNTGEGIMPGITIVKDEPPPVHPTPEPATILLFGAGAAGLAAFRKKFRKKK
jgi:hypothetical protein